ncbi:MAG TPA: type IV toxin-antitoxin system AbiEi family antitoxin domain-containing protein, partial [Trebonia sp.]
MGSDIPRSLRELARFQGGVVTRKQALAAGISTGAIVSKLKYARWRQIYRGVYATFTGPVSREAGLWAAVLYAGKGAELSHETAAELHGLTDRPAPLIHVTVPAGRRVRPVPGLVIHLSARARNTCFPRGVLPHTFVED